MQHKGKARVAAIVLRNKEILASLKPYKNTIELNRIRFAEEIRDPSSLNLPAVSEMKTKEMEMATKLVEQLTEKFDIANYKDTYTQKLLEIIKDKSKGVKHAIPKLKVVHKKEDDLMSMLKASLENKKSKSS